VRLRADHKTYEVWFKKKQGSVYVKAIKEKKQNMELLYYWKPNETFNDVTLADIHRSMAVADKVAKKKQRLSALTNWTKKLKKIVQLAVVRLSLCVCCEIIVVYILCESQTFKIAAKRIVR